MDSDFGIPRELSPLQQLRSQYHPELPPCLQVLLLLPFICIFVSSLDLLLPSLVHCLQCLDLYVFH